MVQAPTWTQSEENTSSSEGHLAEIKLQSGYMEETQGYDIQCCKDSDHLK